MPELELRIVPPEHPDLADLIRRLDAELLERYPPEEVFLLDFQAPSIRQVVFVVGYLAGVPVACGAFKPLDKGCAELKRFFVHKAVRRQGAASRLLGFLEQAAQKSGYSLMRLETGTGQPEAIRFYERQGYLPIEKYGEYADCPSSLC